MLSPSQQKEHILGRIGYGNSPAASARYDQLGPVEYIEQQLSGTLPAISQDGVFIESKVERSALEPRQLEAVLLDFWYNHFNIFVKNNDPSTRLNSSIGRHVPEFQNQAIAPHILGNFGDLLLATAKSTCMLRYLDNRSNRVPGFDQDGKPYGYNENYAREVMELHTLGLNGGPNGGYTQTDVEEATKILTGWTFDVNKDAPATEVFYFNPGYHNNDAKTVLGVTYPAGGGVEEGEAFLNFIATQQSTAYFISHKLCTRFVGLNPSASVIRDVAEEFDRTKGDLLAAMTVLLTHDAFLEPDFDNFRSKVKPAHRFVASALMGMGLTNKSAPGWSDLIAELALRIQSAGDTPYSFPAPIGYPEVDGYWMSTASALVRFEIALVLAYNEPLRNMLATRIAGNPANVTAMFGRNLSLMFDAIQVALIPGGVHEGTKAAALDHVAANATTEEEEISAITHMLLCSSEFMRY